MPRGPYIRSVRREVEGSVRIATKDEMLDAWKASALNRLSPVLLDTKFRVASLDAVKLFLRWSKVDSKPYVAEHFDCDDFACVMRAQARRRIRLNSIGEVVDWSGRHAYNAVVVHDGPRTPIRVVVFEPQTDRTITPGTGMYSALRGFAIF